MAFQCLITFKFGLTVLAFYSCFSHIFNNLNYNLIIIITNQCFEPVQIILFLHKFLSFGDNTRSSWTFQFDCKLMVGHPQKQTFETVRQRAFWNQKLVDITQPL